MNERQNVVKRGVFISKLWFFIICPWWCIPFMFMMGIPVGLYGVGIISFGIVFGIVCTIRGWGRFINISSKGVWNKKYSYDWKNMKLTMFSSLAFGSSCAVAFGDRYYNRSDKGMILKNALCLELTPERIAMIMTFYSDRIRFLEGFKPKRYLPIMKTLIEHGATFIT